MKICYVNLSKQYSQERKKLLPIIDKVLKKGKYISGDHVEKFEKNITSLLKIKYCQLCFKSICLGI